MQIVLGNEVYALRKGHYASGHLALRLMNITGESVAELSVDVPGVSR